MKSVPESAVVVWMNEGWEKGGSERKGMKRFIGWISDVVFKV